MLKFDDKYSNTKLNNLYIQEEEKAIQARALQIGFEYINLEGQSLNPEAIAAIPEQKSKDVELVGFRLNRNILSVAAKDPTSPKSQKFLQKLLDQKYELKVYICSTVSLEHVWKRYQDITSSLSKKKGVFDMDEEDISRLISHIKRKEDVTKLLENIKSINSSRRVTETLELIFAGGLALRASDVHIEPEKSAVRLRYRFDGVLHDIIDIDSSIYKRILSRLKLLSGMILNSHKEAQDGRFTFNASDRLVEVRSSIIPGAIGESIVMRLLDPSSASFNIDKINLNPHIEAVIRREIKKPNGLIITTGPTGSGKTTALYSFLQETHNEGVKIITIENPVEYKLEGIVQTQTGDDYTFSSGLRAVLRQDPDIIMVGEIRDHEVAETAIHAAQTGHLVFSTLHTNSAIAGFPRLMDLGVDPRVMGSSINLIIGQRLIRLLCPDCKKSYQASPEEMNLIKYVMNKHPFPTKITDTITLYKKGSCNLCGKTGFKGRVGIFEGVLMTDEVEEVIIRDPREHLIAKAAKSQNIPNLIEDGIDKILKGTSSLKELERVVELPYQKANAVPTVEKKSPALSEDDNFLSHIV